MLTRSRLLLSAATLIIAAFVTACGGDDDSSGNGAATNVTPGANPTSPAVAPTTPPVAGTSSPDDTLGSARQAFAQVASYRANINATAQGQTTQIVVEVETPDRYHAEIGVGASSIEVIGIGSQTYANLGGVWQAAPSSTLPISPDTLLGQVEGFLNSPQVTQTGASTVDGVSCQVYSVSLPNSAQQAELCISNDGLPRQLEYTDPSGNITVTYTDYGANFNIQAPI